MHTFHIYTYIATDSLKEDFSEMRKPIYKMPLSHRDGKRVAQEPTKYHYTYVNMVPYLVSGGEINAPVI